MAVGDGFRSAIAEYQQQIPTFLAGVGEFGIERIKTRTRQQNVDRYGKSFTAYSPRYASRKGVAPGNVTLTDTGRMLGSLEVQDGAGIRFNPKGRGSQFIDASGDFISARDVKVQIGFSDPAMAQRMRYHASPESRGRIPLRDPMGLDEAGVEQSVNFNLDRLRVPTDSIDNINFEFSLG